MRASSTPASKPPSPVPAAVPVHVDPCVAPDDLGSASVSAPPGLQRLLRPVVISIAAGVAIYAAVAVAVDMTAVADAAIRLGVSGWGLVLGASLLNYALRFLRWHGYLRQLGAHVPAAWHLAYYLAGFGFTTTPGKTGEAVRSLYLKRHGVGYAESLGCLFVERVLDLAAMMLLATAAAWHFSSVRFPVFVAVALILALMPLVRLPALQRWLQGLATAPDGRGFRRFAGHLSTLVRASASLLTAPRLYGGLALGLIAWGAEAVGFWIILNVLDVDLPLHLCAGIYAVAMLAGALSFLPGGLGSTEAVMALLLQASGVDPSVALAATLICRVATLWFAVVIGLLSFGGLMIAKREMGS